MHTALTIAGSDCSGGAGIQADLKTMLANGVYAMSAITSLTAQNTTGITAIQDVSPDFLRAEIDAVFTDIFPDAVKIGMVSGADLIHVIADMLKQYHAGNVVIDPVMISTSGRRLLSEDALEVLTKELLPLADLVTPNIPEAEVFCGMKISSGEDMLRGAEKISRLYGTSVLLKGGHSTADADDLLLLDGQAHWLKGQRIDNPNTHGTGCTLSSAIASNLAKGADLLTAVARAKDYISGAIGAMLDLGHGNGPLDHGFDLRSEYI